jgi:hypothetical protein
MNVPFSRVERGSPEHPMTVTIAIATHRPLINDVAFVRTSFLLELIEQFSCPPGL